jgi:BMFP domain-containing protein YqiC
MSALKTILYEYVVTEYWQELLFDEAVAEYAELEYAASGLTQMKAENATLRTRIAELENEVENRTFGKWGIMKRLAEENGQLKNRIAELEAQLEWQSIETAPKEQK